MPRQNSQPAMELTYFDDKSDVFQTNRKSFDDFLREVRATLCP